MPNEDWGREPERQPVAEEGEEVLFREPGRILDKGNQARGVDCRSHSFAVTRWHGTTYLLVRHGGGDERLKLSWSGRTADALAALDSDNRYWLCHTLLDVAHSAAREARDETASEYRKAFVNGTLKKRKMPARGFVKVWIDRTVAVGEDAA